MTSKHQHPRAHRHLTPANFKPPFSLLAMSAWQRLGLAGVALAVLWVLVIWALREAA
ncbi:MULTISPECIES: hypothetical protein [Chromobacterium]|uniref:Energy transducer TonB n=1 Tax=Chromobacterium haemolyticum TaxID=394935 RepID=A0ABS3GS73_9NEIS|nr:MULTISPECIES: hypothetical protein [Chromobacterium]MBK0416744.1 hypothetical protein [Chromobacterium haemolyticum]MBO0417914.1 hypothetical protein [Chromobacterium haemolyticum]MBO0501131.1 hypothetical protein [Chromobacterium haemolyticum]QOD83929.1 hypothetical protein IEZ30_05485 [Chromobacterium haemolyticum]